MKKIFLFFTALLIATAIFGQTLIPNYNDTFASKLNVYNFGGKSHILAILKTGNNSTVNKVFTNFTY